MDEAGVKLRAAPSAAWESRQWAESLLHAWGLDEVSDDVLFIVSELVANAVRHTHTPPRVRLQRDDGRVRVEVEDRAMDCGPDECDPPPSAMNGRGLHIVGMLAGTWGSDLVPGGKVVWAELPVASR